MFLTLLRKDWRLAKPAFWLTFSLVFVPPLVGVLLTAYSRIFDNAGPLWRYSNDDHHSLIELFLGGYLMSGLAIPAVAASLLARERRERSHAFLASLPISRSRILASKGVVALMLFAIPTAIAWTTASLSNPSFYGNARMENLFTPLLVETAFCVGIGGLGWILASILPSEVLSSAAALVLAITAFFGVILAFAVVPSLRNIAPGQIEETRNLILIAIYCFFALTGITGGTLISCLRSSP